MEERRIDVFAPGVIVHPLLGKCQELTAQDIVFSLRSSLLSSAYDIQVKHTQVVKETILGLDTGSF